MENKFELCGGIARWIYSQSLLSEIKSEATSSFGSNKLCNQASNFLGDEYTHKLIHVHTNLEESNEGNGPYTASFCFLGPNIL